MMIHVSNMTLTYPNKKGVFDLSFDVKKGEVVGYLGPNGSGKTTTIRALLGFIKANSGEVIINGLNAFNDASQIMKVVGYLPGEISFLKGLTVKQLLSYTLKFRNSHESEKMEKLLHYFQLNVNGDIKTLSKGEKQKLALVIAFMNDAKLLILDEPTSGLDPLMRNKFIELVLEEKKAGKTIFMSSHLFDEIEKTCDKVLIIKKGRIVQESNLKTLKSQERKCFLIKTAEEDKLKYLGYPLGEKSAFGVEVFVYGDQIDGFLKAISTLKIISFEERKQNLEEIFLNLYKE
ncbi:MAG: ABC transporter ATP-binding protein [Acholeplasmataceae bacterium]|nr:ABC transporter ATP-binding protein [Acholeplasmataceae bacterium]MCK9427208.1 ABC transporter ATP-binding protein [Acholeplasmataceae bacterium]MDD4090330.1 ABC transporter ATP-binding protein [Acholeplasmataceae bacterium]